MLILSIRNIVGVFVVVVVVNSAQIPDSDARTNVINVGVAEKDSDDDVFYEADVTLQSRDKRTIGTILSGVADLFGYDVQRRPSLLPLQSAPPVQPAVVAAVPVPLNTFADPGPFFARQAAPGGPPPAGPAPAAPGPPGPAPAGGGPPVTAPVTLTDGVRRAFQLGVNWSNQRQQIGGAPPAPAGPPPAAPPPAAGPAPAPPPAAAAPPPPAAAPPPPPPQIQGERRSYTVGLNWQNLRQQLGGPPPGPAPAAPPPAGGAPPPAAPAAAGPPPPQGFRQSYQVGFDFSNQRQQLGGPPPGPAAPQAAGPPGPAAAPPPPAAAGPAPAAAGAAAPPPGAPIANLGNVPPRRVPELIRQRPTLVDRYYFNKDRGLPVKKTYYPKEINFDGRPPRPIRLDTPPGERPNQPPVPEENQNEEEDEENEEEDDSNDETVEKEESPRSSQGTPQAKGWRKEDTGDPNEQAYVLEEDYTYGDKPKKVSIDFPDYTEESKDQKRAILKTNSKFNSLKKLRSDSRDYLSATPLTLLQRLTDEIPEEIRQFNGEFNHHHRSEEGQKQLEAPVAEKVQPVTTAKPVLQVDTNDYHGNDHGDVHRQHQNILRQVADNFENQHRTLSNNYPSARGIDNREEIKIYHSKALDGIVKNFEKNAKNELLSDKRLANEHKQILENLRENTLKARQDENREEEGEKEVEQAKEKEEVKQEGPVKETVGAGQRETVREQQEGNVEREVSNPEDYEEEEAEDEAEDEAEEETEENAEEEAEQNDGRVKVGNEDVVGPNDEFENIKVENKIEPIKEFESVTQDEPKVENKKAEGPENKNQKENKDVFDFTYFFKPSDFVKQLEKSIYTDYGKKDYFGKAIEEKSESNEKDRKVGFPRAEEPDKTNVEYENAEKEQEEEDDGEEESADEDEVEKSNIEQEQLKEEQEESKQQENEKPEILENQQEQPNKGEETEEDDEEPERTDESDEKQAANSKSEEKLKDKNKEAEAKEESETEAAEKERKAAEEERKAEEKRKAAEERKAAEAERKAAEEERKAAEEERKAAEEEERKAEEEAARLREEEAERLRKEEEKRRQLEENEKELKEYIHKHFEVDVINGLAVPKGVKDTERYKQIVKSVREPIPTEFFSPDEYRFKKIDGFFGQNFFDNQDKLDKSDNRVEEKDEEERSEEKEAEGEEETEDGEAESEEERPNENESQEEETEDDEAESEESEEPCSQTNEGEEEKGNEEESEANDEDSGEEEEEEAESKPHPKGEEEAESKPHPKEEQSKQTATLQYPHELKYEEIYSQFRKRLTNPETQDSNKFEVVQPLLHTGGFKPGGVEVLDNPEKLLSVPFDYDYSSSEKKVVVEPTPLTLKRVRRNVDGLFPRIAKRIFKREVDEIHWNYQPERYDPHFTYVVPEPKIIDKTKTEKKPKFEDNDEDLSPTAIVTQNESGRRKTYVRVNKKEQTTY